jgi:hypothetical protein
MASLLELVRARREELEQAQPELRITDEQRICAFLALQQQAERGDPDAKRRMERLREILARVTVDGACRRERP